MPNSPLRFSRAPPSQLVVCQPCRLSFSLSEFLPNCHDVWIFSHLSTHKWKLWYMLQTQNNYKCSQWEMPNSPLRFSQIPLPWLVVCPPCRLFFSLSEFLSNCHGVWIFSLLFYYVHPNESDDTCWWLEKTTSAANGKSQILLYGSREFHLHNLWSVNPVDYLSHCLNFCPIVMAGGYLVICLPTNESDDTCWWLRTITSAANWKSQILLYGFREFHLHNLWSANPVHYLSCSLNFYSILTACGYLVICLPKNESNDPCWWLITATSEANGKSQILLYSSHKFHLHNLWSANPVDYLSRCLNFYPIVTACGYLVICLLTNESDDTC